MKPIRLYRFALSGHCHRVELMLSLLELPVERVDVDLAAGAQKTPEYLAKNPFGQVPAIEDAGVTLADSNSILVYLAAKYDTSGRWYPREPLAAARVQQWLSLAAGPLAFGAAAARVHKLFGAPIDHGRACAIANGLFEQMERHLGSRHFLTTDFPTIADVAMYSYTAHAPEGAVSLEPYAAVRRWLARIEALPHFVPMARTRQAA
jgi:glutathione S-transferase